MKQAHVEIALIIVNITLLLYLVYCHTIGDRLEESFHEVIDDIVPHNHYDDSSTSIDQNSGCKNDATTGSNVCIQTNISDSAQLYLDAKGIRDELFTGFQAKEDLLNGYKVNLIADINTEINGLNIKINDEETTITINDIQTCFDNIHRKTLDTYVNIYTIMDWVRLKEEGVKAKDEDAQASNDVSTDIKDAISDIRSEVRTKSIDLYDKVLTAFHDVTEHIKIVGVDTYTTFKEASLIASANAKDGIADSLPYTRYIDEALDRLEYAKQAQLYATIAQMVANTLARIGLYTYEQLYYNSADCDGNGCINPGGGYITGSNLLYPIPGYTTYPDFDETLYNYMYDDTESSVSNTQAAAIALNAAVIMKINDRNTLITNRKDGIPTAYDATNYGDTDLTEDQGGTTIDLKQSVSAAQTAFVTQNTKFLNVLYPLIFTDIQYSYYIIVIAADIPLKANNAQTAATEAQTAAIAAYNHVTSEEFLNDTSQFMLGEPGTNCVSPYSFFTANDRDLCRITAKQWLNEELKSIISLDFTVDTEDDIYKLGRLRCHVGGVSISEPWIRWNNMSFDLTNGDEYHRPVCKKV